MKMMPNPPHIRPPAPCRIAKNATPPNMLSSNLGFIKKVPMMPDMKVERKETATSMKEPARRRSRLFLYPRSFAAASKAILAAVNPRKWSAPGLGMKLRIVPIIPLKNVAPALRVHQTVRMRRDVPHHIA